jgi:hypothetical protein
MNRKNPLVARQINIGRANAAAAMTPGPLCCNNRWLTRQTKSVVHVSERTVDFHTTARRGRELSGLVARRVGPVGAFLFGRVAGHLGRKPAVMLSIVCYSIAELATAASSSLDMFLVLRALFGIGMGGVWGVGASLAFETVPAGSRGAVRSHRMTRDVYSWGCPSTAGILYPAHRARVDCLGRFERPAQGKWATALPVRALESRAVRHRLMACFNFFSHGTQDLYPLFLQKQHGFSTQITSRVAITYNVGAICGGLLFGTLSSRLGRRKMIALASVCRSRRFLSGLMVQLLWVSRLARSSCSSWCRARGASCLPI